MKGFGFTMLMIIFVGLLGYGGYSAIVHLSDPKSYVPKDSEKLGDLHPVVTEPETATDTVPVPVVSASTTPPVPGSQGTMLAGNLQSLISAGTILKRGSKGASVGYVQQFMNVYFARASKVDNDFGASLVTSVKKFQLQNKLPQTGQVGKGTLQMMVMWLGNNPQAN